MSLLHESVSRSIIGAFYRVYNKLGFGFLERLYVNALERELRKHGHEVAREMLVRVLYEGEDLGVQRIDMVVDRVVIVEVKSTHDLHKSARRQLYNYLHATSFEVGLLLHFGPVPSFQRIVCSKGPVAPRVSAPTA